LQNTASQFGASLGTALAGSVLITALTASFLSLLAANPDVTAEVSKQATIELESGIPFVSDQDLEKALADTSIDEQTTDAILEDYGRARLEGIRTALALLAIFGVIALYFTRRIPDRPPGSSPAGAGLSGHLRPRSTQRSGQADARLSWRPGRVGCSPRAGSSENTP
jgi:hypothetical protein